MTQTDQKTVPKLRFPGFEKAWERKPLAESFPKIRNGFVGTATPFYQEPGITYLQGKNIKRGILDTKNTVSVSETFHAKQNKSKVKPFDILMVQSGHVGECAFVPESIGEANCHALVVMTPTSGTYSPFFVYYFYAEAGQRHIYKITTGNTVQHILTSDLKPLAVASPTLPEQRKIADFLGAVDTKIAQLARKKALLEDYKKGCMQQLFSQKIRFKDDDGKDFPDWEEKRLGEVATKTASSISASSLHESPGEYPVYGASGVAGHVDYFTSDDYHIGVVKDGAGVGRLYYCPPKSSILGTLESVKASNRNVTKFIYYWMLQINFAAYSTGSTIPHVYFKDYGKRRGRFPHPDEQRKIADFLSTLDRKIDLVAQELTHARSFKQGLLQQMFV